MAELMSFKDLAFGFVDDLTKKHTDPEKHRGFRTHIPEFNHILGGLGRKWYVVIGGPEKSGKTAFAVSLLAEFGKSKLNVMMITLEMDNLQVAARIFSNVSAVEMTKFRDLTLEDEDWEALHQAKKEIAKFKGHSGFGFFAVEQIVELVNEHKPDVVFVDYVQLMHSQRRSKGRVEELEYISRTLKQLTINPGVLVIAMVQVNQEGAKAKNFNSPYIFHGSATFKNDADLAIVIAPHNNEAGEEEPGLRDCHIVASRHSYKASFQLAFLGARSLIAGATLDMGELETMYADAFGDDTVLVFENETDPDWLDEVAIEQEPVEKLGLLEFVT